MTKEHPFNTMLAMSEKEFHKEEFTVETCKDRFRCLSNMKRECSCIYRPITYTFGIRKTIQEAAEYYKDDVCLKECTRLSFCKKKGFIMKIKGVSGRNGEWEKSQTINRQSTYPLFRWKIFCRAYEKKKHEAIENDSENL